MIRAYDCGFIVVYWKVIIVVIVGVGGSSSFMLVSAYFFLSSLFAWANFDFYDALLWFAIKKSSRDRSRLISPTLPLFFSAVAVMMLLLTLLLIHIHHYRRKFIWARQRAYSERKWWSEKGKISWGERDSIKARCVFFRMCFTFFLLMVERENFLNLKSLRYWKSSLIRLDVLLLLLCGCCWR